MRSDIERRIQKLEAQPWRSGRRILVAWPQDDPQVFLANGKPVTAHQWEALLTDTATVIVVRRSEQPHEAQLTP